MTVPPRLVRGAGTVIAIVMAGTGLLVSCTGQGSQGSKPAATGSTIVSPTPAGRPPLTSPQLVGQPTVLFWSYSLPGTTGYETAVVFRVKNPIALALIEAPYRVEVNGPDGQVLGNSTGNETFTLGGRQERPVVWHGSLQGVRPTSAKVSLYSVTPASKTLTDAIPSQAQFDTGNRYINCNTRVTACDATGDLTWNGSQSVTVHKLIVIVHQGSDISGAAVAGGYGSLSNQTSGNDLMQPGQTLPFSVPVTANEGSLPDVKTGEVYIEAIMQR